MFSQKGSHHQYLCWRKREKFRNTIIQLKRDDNILFYSIIVFLVLEFLLYASMSMTYLEMKSLFCKSFICIIYLIATNVYSGLLILQNQLIYTYSFYFLIRILIRILYTILQFTLSKISNKILRLTFYRSVQFSKPLFSNYFLNKSPIFYQRKRANMMKRKFDLFFHFVKSPWCKIAYKWEQMMQQKFNMKLKTKIWTWNNEEIVKTTYCL